jgi:hypothetical protein
MSTPDLPVLHNFFTTLCNRLDNQAKEICQLKKRVAELEQPVVTPMNPYAIQFSNRMLSFTLDNAKYLDFVDIRIDGTTWEQQWAKTFKVVGNVVSVDLSKYEVKESLEIFTRYDTHTKSADAGHAFFTLNKE